MRESAVEKYLHSEVTKAGGTTRKFSSPGRSHVPDRLVIWPAGSLCTSCAIHFVECKAPGKKPRDGQSREHDRLKTLGCRVLVLDSKEVVDNYVLANKAKPADEIL